MKQSITFSQFVDAFRAYDRYDDFGYQSLRAIFDYLEQYEQDTGEEIELDVIAICCDFAEDDAQDIAQNYSIDIEGLDDEEVCDAVRKYLEENTIIVGEPSEGLFVYQVF
jgi:hypothetical protein